MNKSFSSKVFLLLIFFCYSNYNFSQVDFFLGKRLPSLEIKSLLNFKDLSSADWKNEMKKYFSNSQISTRCANGTAYSETLGSSGIISVEWNRCPDGTLMIVFMDLFDQTTKSYLSGIIDKLEKFYVKSEDNRTFYRIDTDKYFYVFVITLSNGSEILSISRFDM